jgi:hypothetical protein
MTVGRVVRQFSYFGVRASVSLRYFVSMQRRSRALVHEDACRELGLPGQATSDKSRPGRGRPENLTAVNNSPSRRNMLSIRGLA